MRFERLDLNLLVALDVLLETRSVTQSARKLNLSQPSVSAALSRLRDYFGDELLTLAGRRMVPTTKAEEIWPAVKDMLNIVRFKITNPEGYDPLLSERRFRIVASDYAYDVLLSKVIAQAEQLAPLATFDLSTPAPQRVKQFQNGDIDLMITVETYALEGHPSLELFVDEDAAICWNRGRYAQGLSANEFLEASHAVAVFGQEQLPTVTEIHFAEHMISRRISVRVPGFASLPGAVVGTNRVATMHRRHAEFFAALYPIAIHSLPLSGPDIREVVQWHRLRQNDDGVRWLIHQLKGEADKFG